MSFASKVWFITGCSTGLGRDLVQTVLARNDKVIATGRRLSAVQDLASKHCKVLELDVNSSFEAIKAKIQEAIGFWGHVDVVVNNSGFGVFGTVEEQGEEDYMKQFKTNLFGCINVTNAFVPHLRERGEGTIVNVGSRSAWRTNVPFMGSYCASKAAMHAMTESLSVELAPFNIRTLLVQPGGLRTSAWGNAVYIPPERQIAAYDVMRTRALDFARVQGGQPPGDPLKAAAAIADVVRGEGVAQGRAWPDILVLGDDAERDIRAKCAQTLATMDEWADVTRGIRLDDTSD